MSWNRAAELMFGYTPEEAIGRRIADLTAPDEVRDEASIMRQDGLEPPVQSRFHSMSQLNVRAAGRGLLPLPRTHHDGAAR